MQQKKKERLVPTDPSSTQYFKVQAVAESSNLPHYDRLLAQIDNDYLVLTCTPQTITDILAVSTTGFRHVLRL